MQQVTQFAKPFVFSLKLSVI